MRALLFSICICCISICFAVNTTAKDYFLKLDEPLAESLIQGSNLSQWSSVTALNDKLLAFNTIEVSKAFKLNDSRLRTIFIVTISKNFEEFEEQISHISGVQYIEEVPQYETFVVPNDVHINQWNLAKVNAFDAFDIVADASSVTIAIVDDAVLTTHPDLQANIYQNPNEVINGIDDDGNGFIDDVNGFDVADNDNDASPPSTASSSNFSHGTHCAGIASAVTNNNLGIASFGMNAKILPVKCKPDASSGGSLPFAYKGLEYAITTDCDVISMSWGGGFYSLTYQTLIDIAHSKGKVLIAAAGNSNVSAPMYPASYNHVINVAASQQQDKKASFSNYGNTIDVTAPGMNIWSAVAGSTTYDYMSGTSMACPLVSGIAALMIANNPGTSPDSLESCLKRSCDNIDLENPNYINQLGAGRVNAFKALTCQSKSPFANFSNSSKGCPGKTIQFSDQSSGKEPRTYNWSFPGGVPATSTLKNPTVVYNTPGVYDVTLEVTNSFGSDTRTKKNVIIIEEPFAKISGDYQIPAGLRANVTVEMNGTPPYSFVITDGTNDYSYSDIYYSPYFIDFGPVSESTTVELKSFYDANCDGKKIGESVIEIIGDTCVSVIFNGDFKIADNANCKPVGWETDMVLDCVKPGSGPPGLFVSPNGTDWNGGYWSGVIDHTPGGGTNVVLGDGPANTSRLWYQYVSVEKGKTYDFSAWFVNANVNGNYTGYTSSFEIRVKGMSGPLLGKIGPLGQTTPWTQLLGQYTATATENIEIDIIIIGGPSGGNDFAIDDVSFKCSGTSVPCFKSSSTSKEVCSGDSITLSAGQGKNYKWYPEISVSKPGARTVKVSPSYSQYIACHYKDNDSCLVIDSFYVNLNAKPSVEIDRDSLNLCVGDTIIVSASGAKSYLWTANNSPSTLMGSSVLIFPSADITYVVIGTSDNGCIARDTLPVRVQNCCSSEPKIGIASDSIICAGDELSFLNLSSPKGNPTYKWTFGKGAIPETFNGATPPIVKFADGKSYAVKLILTDDCGVDSTTQLVHCIEVPVNAGIDTSLCFGDEYKIGDIGISDNDYIWSPCTNLSDCEYANPLAAIDGDIEYVVTVTDRFSSCTARDTVSLSELSRVGFSELEDQRICEGDTAILSVSPQGQNVLWQDGSTDTVYRVVKEELVWVTLSNANCDFTDSAFISFYNCSYPYVVNSFSPNNDNLNDDFGLLIDFAVENYVFQVFNRWGEMLFESKIPNERWDGTYKGKPVQTGSYLWQVNYTNTETLARSAETFAGVVTLLR